MLVTQLVGTSGKVFNGRAPSGSGSNGKSRHVIFGLLVERLKTSLLIEVHLLNEWLEESVRDQLFCGIQCEGIRQRLFQEDHFDFSKA